MATCLQQIQDTTHNVGALHHKPVVSADKSVVYTHTLKWTCRLRTLSTRSSILTTYNKKKQGLIHCYKSYKILQYLNETRTVYSRAQKTDLIYTKLTFRNVTLFFKTTNLEDQRLSPLERRKSKIFGNGINKRKLHI